MRHNVADNCCTLETPFGHAADALFGFDELLLPGVLDPGQNVLGDVVHLLLRQPVPALLCASELLQHDGFPSHAVRLSRDLLVPFCAHQCAASDCSSVSDEHGPFATVQLLVHAARTVSQRRVEVLLQRPALQRFAAVLFLWSEFGSPPICSSVSSP